MLEALQQTVRDAHAECAEKIFEVIRQSLKNNVPIIILSGHLTVRLVEGFLEEKGIPLGEENNGVVVRASFGCCEKDYVIIKASHLLP